MSLNLFAYGESGTSSSESEDEKQVTEEKETVSPPKATSEIEPPKPTPLSNEKKELRSLPSSLSNTKSISFLVIIYIDTIKLPSFTDGVPTIVLDNRLFHSIFFIYRSS